MTIFSGIGDAAAAAALVLAVILLIVVIIQQGRIRRLDERITALSSGADGESLEDMLINILESYSGISRQTEDNAEDIKDIYRRLHYAVQKIGIVKYDAFKQMGGNLSSVIAFLDQDNNGFLFNTVQNIDGCYSYVKQVRNGKSDVALTDEEQAAMERAMASQKKPSQKKS